MQEIDYPEGMFHKNHSTSKKKQSAAGKKVYARFVKKMAYNSKLILSIILIYSWIGLQYMWCNVKNYRLFETTHAEIAYRKRKKLCL